LLAAARSARLVPESDAAIRAGEETVIAKQPERQNQAAAQQGRVAAAVYERLPYALVVVDEQGSVLTANPAAIEMGWHTDDGAPPTVCHEMFACRRAGAPCAHGCLVQRASQSGANLPEIRIDTLPDSTVSAFWVTVVPLALGSGVLLHLRPGDARDRRRRSDPHWINGPELTIKALGRIRVDSSEGPLGGSWLQHRPGQILKYLVCERDRVVQADEIAEALWPSSGRQALSSVRHFVHALRDKLEPGRAPRAESRFVVTVRGGYAVNRRHVRIDADTFCDAVRDGLAAADRGEADLAGELLELALSLYRGDLLEDEPYAEWAMPERDRLRAMATDGLRALTHLALGRGDHGTAVKHLDRLAEFEPFDSDIHKELLRVLLVAGRRSEALRRYSTFRARVSREFRASPGFALSDLHGG
jgi:DNA-binding SARP family transcriptional activator